MPRVGIATVPLDTGRCPPWLFERMKRLSRGIMIAIAEEFGTDEILRRLSDPVWFQSLGCVIGFDWNSSGLGTTTMGALKEGLRGLENDLGIFVCGGKGKTSRKTPQQIQNWGEFLGLSMEKIDKLVYASKISAKVDSNLVQDGYQLYHHNLIFSKNGQWTVVQQGMNINNQTARRYHWLSSNIKDFIEEPHSGIISDARVKPLNLTAKESDKNREISTELVIEEPKTFLKDIRLISKHSNSITKTKNLFETDSQNRRPSELGVTSLIKKRKIGNFTEMELRDIEFYWHPVVQEKFDLKRLEKTIFFAKSQEPENFEQLLALKGIGPRTIRALSLVSEIIYGAKPSYEDPARYSFSVGGKDGSPYYPKISEYNALLNVVEKGIKKAKIENRERVSAIKRLHNSVGYGKR